MTAIINGTSTGGDSPKRQKVSNGEIPSAVSGFNGEGIIDNSQDLMYTEGSIPLLPRDAKVLLLDIEGCTTSISFVKDTLFPFVLESLDSYLDTLESNALTDLCNNLQKDMDALDSQHPSKVNYHPLDTQEMTITLTKENIRDLVQRMMKHDVKATGLKQMQGTMWKSGYTDGTLKGHVYDDFVPMLKWCREHNVSVNIYSSGSIGAQKLLFGYSDQGDLCSYFDQHFDTTSGGKKEVESYRTISKALGVVDAAEVVFVSDAEAELVAARGAGIGFPVMSVRPGNAPLTSTGREFPRIFSLLQLCGSGR